MPPPPAQVLADPHWLPFPENSLDLVVLPRLLVIGDPERVLASVSGGAAWTWKPVR